jgi:hypothetical protein
VLTTARRRILFFVPLGLLLLAAPAHAIYLFYMREDLDRVIREHPEQVVGKKVVFTDELCVIWPQVQQRPDTLDGQRYVLFDTAKFHCAVPQNQVGAHLQQIWDDAQKGYGDVLKQLEDINDQLRARQMSETDAQTRRHDLYWQLYKVWSDKPIVTVFGTVARADFWGPVRGRENGVATEAITVVVDRVEKPRDRWYEEGLDEHPLTDQGDGE